MIKTQTARWASSVVLVCVAISTVGFSGASYADTGATYVKSPLHDAIYQVSPSTSGGADTCTQLSQAQWTALGSPAPTILPASYDQVPGFAYIFGDVTLCGVVQEDALTFNQWRSLGSPAPAHNYNIQDRYFFHYQSSPSEIFIALTSPEIVAPELRVTYQQWIDAGRPSTEYNSAYYVKFRWAPWIFGANGPNQGFLYGLPYDTWVFRGSPTPAVINGLPGGKFIRYTGSPVVYYSVPGYSLFQLNYSEWVAAGSPQPIEESP